MLQTRTEDNNIIRHCSLDQYLPTITSYPPTSPGPEDYTDHNKNGPTVGKKPLRLEK